MRFELKKLLQYKNENVITRYQNDHPHSTMLPDEALTELLKYIWICHQHAEDKKRFPDNPSLQFSCVMHQEMKEIDNMWHCFILFTRDYQTFCQDYLYGKFFHHDPVTSDKEISKDEYEQELTRYLSYIYDHLGEDTIIKWFAPELRNT